MVDYACPQLERSDQRGVAVLGQSLGLGRLSNKGTFVIPPLLPSFGNHV